MNKLDELEQLRKRAGIVFKKSFRCEDAEKNIHLLDINTFFKKFKIKLDKLGYTPSADFDFNIIKPKYYYAERHHTGKNYRWKYFYSSTFDISDDLIDYLLEHRFIFPKKKLIKLSEKNISFGVEPPKQTTKCTHRAQSDYVMNLLQQGKTYSEVRQHLREKLESYNDQLMLLQENLDNATEYEQQKIFLDIADTKKKSRIMRFCLIELAKTVDPEITRKVTGTPLRKLIPVIQMGITHKEALEYFEHKMKERSETINIANATFKNKNLSESTTKLYYKSPKKYQKDIEDFSACIEALKTEEYKAFFE